MFNSILPNLGSALLKQTTALIKSLPTSLNQVRTRITCSRGNGKPKSVRTAMARALRLDKRIWIHAAPGYHHKLWKKPLEKRYLLQQTYLADRGLARTLERMAGTYFKKIDLRRFVDKPLSLYQPFLKKKEIKFYP